MLLTKEVEVKPSGKSIQYYKDKGYDAKHHQPLMIKIEDLSRFSNIHISVLCDYCGKECSPRYVDYCNSIDIDGTYACSHCTIKKAEKTVQNKYGVKNYSSTKECREKVSNTLMKLYGISHISESEEFMKRKRENNMKKYGVEHTLQVKEFRDKGIQTNIEKYGVEHVLQNQEVKERMQNTVREKYGVPFVSQNLDIKKKIMQTNLEKYGYENVLSSPDIRKKISDTIKDVYNVDNVSQSDEIKQKKANTTLLHYGVEHPSLSKEIVEKRMNTLYKNGTTQTSKQQLYVFELCNKNYKNIKLNYPISYYNADICFIAEKIDIEIDFGGHNLQVKLGKITQEEFDRKELIRDRVIKKEGYKIIRIVSRKDRLPQDSTLLQMLSDAKQYFSETNHSWCTYDIDKSLLINAEHKDGIHYSFGELRTIKDSDISNISKNSDLAIENNNLSAVQTA